MKLTHLLAAALLSISLPLFAHDDATLDHMKSPHGGQLRMAGPFHLELILEKGTALKEKAVVVYVTDHAGTLIPTAGTTAKITLLDNGKTEATLQPAGANSLKGVAKYIGNEKTKAIVSFTIQNETYQARFTPFAMMAMPMPMK